jgi:hypothetical protein
MTRRTLLLLCVAFLVLGAPQAHAYIDPGTGSSLFQIVAAALITTGFVLRSGWQRIRAYLARLLGRER